MILEIASENYVECALQKAWRAYKEWAATNIPEEARREDGGAHWMSLHAASFRATNPSVNCPGFKPPSYSREWHSKYASHHLPAGAPNMTIVAPTLASCVKTKSQLREHFQRVVNH